ncbi:hypothetical protein AAF712_011993 [Marasmius tenuissimus]|uniref:Integral membrane protein n=1 Tax=Marasmius tenuissimus TaxID=585030 RepID=A0ABR2ZKC2_9AGAR
MDSQDSSQSTDVLDLPATHEGIFLTCLHSLAVFFTILRLARRTRIKRLSWDDGFAGLSALLVVAFLAMCWAEKLTTDPSAYAKRRGVVSSALTGLGISAVWTSRISLSLAMARILPPSQVRTAAIMLAGGCFMMWSITMIYQEVALALLRGHTSWPAWKLCIVAACQMITDGLSTLMLVILPLYVLWRNSTTLRASDRRLVVILLASNVLGLIVVYLQIAFTIEGYTDGLLYSIHLEVAISVMGCSALVVFTVLSKLLSRTRRRRKARVGESEEQSLGLDEDEDEYNSGEDPIYYATSRDLGTITGTSMSTIGSQFTEVGETQTYSLGSILEVSSSHLGPGLSRQRSTTDVTVDGGDSIKA